jgi:hypothetical protein
MSWRRSRKRLPSPQTEERDETQARKQQKIKEESNEEDLEVIFARDAGPKVCLQSD